MLTPTPQDLKAIAEKRRVYIYSLPFQTNERTLQDLLKDLNVYVESATATNSLLNCSIMFLQGESDNPLRLEHAPIDRLLRIRRFYHPQRCRQSVVVVIWYQNPRCTVSKLTSISIPLRNAQTP